MTYSDIPRMYSKYGLNPVDGLFVEIEGNPWAVNFGYGNSFVKNLRSHVDVKRFKKVVGLSNNDAAQKIINKTYKVSD